MTFWRFIDSSRDLTTAITGEYRWDLVMLSVGVAMLAGYSALEVVERVDDAGRRITRLAWLCLGAICLGCGIWAMHFIGMLGFQLPLPVRYDLAITLISMVPAILASAVALYFLAEKRYDTVSLSVAATLIAVGIGTMHYTGMEAMMVQAADMTYLPMRFAVSIVVALLLAEGALLFKCKLSEQLGFGHLANNVTSGIILGLAVSGMHYTAMSATRFFPGETVLFHEIESPAGDLGVSIGVTATLVILAVLLSVLVDRRLKHLSGRTSVLGLPVAILVLILLLLDFTVFMVDRLEREKKAEQRRALETVLTTTHQALKSWRDQHISTVSIWAESADVREAARDLLASSHSRDALLAAPAQARLREWFPAIRSWTRYRGYFIIAPNGLNLASSRDANVGVANLLLQQRRFMDRVWAGQATISLPMRSDVPLPNERGEMEPQFPTMFVGAPIRDETGKVVAAFTFRIHPMQDFVPILQRGRIGRTGETYAFDDRGRLISESRFTDHLAQIGLVAPTGRAMLQLKLLNPGANLVAGQLNIIPAVRQGFTLMAEESIDGRAGFNVDGYRDYRGVPVVGAWLWDDDARHGLTTEQDLSEAMQGFYNARAAIWTLSGSAIAALMMVALLYVLTRVRQIESAQRTSAILETTVDGVVTWNEAGHIESANDAALKIFGISGSEAGSMELEQLIPQLEGAAYEDVRRFFNTPDGEPLAFEIETQGKRRDQTTFPMEISVSETMLPGGDRLFTGILRDITERKRAEEELLRATAERQRMERDLTIAHEIQMSMLPLEFPPFPDRTQVDIFASLQPAREVGGDFYDFFRLSDDRICFCIGDVSGKGVPSALFMAMAKTLIKSRAADDPSPASIMRHLNNELSKDNDTSMFVTLFICMLDTDNGDLVYTNAGHNPPYVIRDAGELDRIDSIHGPAVGAMPGVEYREEMLRLGQGDTLFAYTDGVTEAMDAERNLFGEERLRELLASLKYESATNIVDTTTDQIRFFEQNSTQSDDITVMAVRLTHSHEESTVLVLELTIENRLKEIEHVNERFNEFAEGHGVASAVTQRFNVALDELLNNIISYGYDEDHTSRIRIRVELAEDRLKVAIASIGKEFDPFTVPEPDTSLPLEEREAGGLGIHIVRNLMDEVSYHRRINQNVVNLLKYLR